MTEEQAGEQPTRAAVDVAARRVASIARRRDETRFASAYVAGTEVGWFDGERRHVEVHPDRAAVADVVRRLSAWLARRAVIEPR